MGEMTQYVCMDCDFVIEDRDLRYFVDEKTGCIVIHSMGMLTFDMGCDSEISGKLIPSFCPQCMKEVHFCHNDDESNVEKIKTCLKTDENDFKDDLDERYPLRSKGIELKGAIGPQDEHGQCPKCGRKVSLVTENIRECPKCGGMFLAIMGALYD